MQWTWSQRRMFDRNGGRCEKNGCNACLERGDTLHWHHTQETEDPTLSVDRSGVKRPIAWNRGTENPELKKIYEKDLKDCVIYCRQHHYAAHREYNDARRAYLKEQRKRAFEQQVKRLIEGGMNAQRARRVALGKRRLNA